MKLIRTAFTPNGVFGILQNSKDMPVAATLEHAYRNGDFWTPKLPAGIYTCKRGIHMLHSGEVETFEVQAVPGHTGILFHVGNYGTDSDGCILLGRSLVYAENGMPYINHSRRTFLDFMDSMHETQSFQLEVI